VKTPSLQRRQLKQYLRRKTASITEAVLRGDTLDAHLEDIRAIELATRLLVISAPKWSGDSSLAVVVAVVCLVISGILWSKPVARTAVTMDANSETVSGRLWADWTVPERVTGQQLLVERLTSIEAPGLGFQTATDGDSWIRVTGSPVTLQSLTIRTGSVIDLRTSENTIRLFISGGKLDGFATVIGSGRAMGGDRIGVATIDRPFRIGEPETISWSLNATQTTIPTVIAIKRSGDWQLGRLPLGDIRFVNEIQSSPGEPGIISSIKSGVLRFDESAWSPRTLLEHERVSLSGARGARVDISVRDNSIHTNVTGLVESVLMGENGRSRQVAPSYLNYLYNSKSAYFFWGCVVFCWGLLWGIRKTLFA
jgi:hypothetical protein